MFEIVEPPTPDRSRAYTFRVEPLQTEVAPTLPVVRPFFRDDLSEDQTSVYDAILSWLDDPNARQFLKLGGLAGTGKTTLIAALAKKLESENQRIAYCAYTGKAVNVLSKKLRTAGVVGDCTTLHSLIYKPRVKSDGSVEGWERKELLSYDLIVVDEASMIGAELWDDLVAYRLPILAVGDHGQLPPVGDSIVNLMHKPDLRLERIHRQAEGNPILAIAQHVRLGGSHYAFEPTDNRVQFIRTFADVCSDVAADPYNAAALCYTNATRVKLNTFVRRSLDRMTHDPYPGDMVVCLKNRKPVFNGMRGRLLVSEEFPDDKWGNFGAVVAFDDERLQLTSKVLRRQFNAPKTIDKLDDIKATDGTTPNSWHPVGMLFDYGYALTCHKAQGSQFKKVAVIYENLFRDADTRNRWLYTAFTRASDQLYIVRPK